jgi:hypothetical protein
LDLMFRNESAAVAVKAKSREKTEPKLSPLFPASTPNSQSPQVKTGYLALGNEITEFSQFYVDTCHGGFTQALLPDYTMAPTVEERALGCFQANSAKWLRDFDLVDSLCPQGHADAHLLASMSAVGLATFSNSMHAPELMVRARRDYVTALQLTNLALRSPTEVKKDSTLFSVMILSIFETVTGSSERSLSAWTEHINGAAALVKLRGREQFRTPAGMRMFLQVTSNLMLSCVQRAIAMPEHIIQLRKEARHFMDIENPSWKLSAVIIDFTIFRAAVRDCKITGPRAVIEAALDIDRRFVAVFDNLSDDWKYEIIYSDDYPESIWNGNYHVYKEYWVAHIWNGMRTCRILLQEVIRDQVLSGSSAMAIIFTEEESKTLNDNAVSTMLKMRADILASVPQYTPEMLKRRPSFLDGSRGYFVLWPLYLVAAMDMTTQPIRKWAIARLRSIGESVGLRQAIVLADSLDGRKHIAAWDTKPVPRPQRISAVEMWMDQTSADSILEV